jgi:hypothetical protein
LLHLVALAIYIVQPSRYASIASFLLVRPSRFAGIASFLLRKKRSDAGKKRGSYNTKKKEELLAAQARANNNKISDAFTRAKMAKKQGH